jgi:hypothetical protein
VVVAGVGDRRGHRGGRVAGNSKLGGGEPVDDHGGRVGRPTIVFLHGPRATARMWVAHRERFADHQCFASRRTTLPSTVTTGTRGRWCRASGRLLMGCGQPPPSQPLGVRACRYRSPCHGPPG